MDSKDIEAQIAQLRRENAVLLARAYEKFNIEPPSGDTTITITHQDRCESTPRRPVSEEEFNTFLSSLRPGPMPNSKEITTQEGQEIFERMLTDGMNFRL